MKTSLMSPADARRKFREGLVAPTAGWCAGYTQANLISVPQEIAFDVMLFAQRNPQACPVLDVMAGGAVSGPLLDGDVRTDVPLYRVYVDGVLAEEATDVTSWWRDDLVTFVIGCSFTFETALQEAGVAVRHIDSGVNVPMYRTSRRCRDAGAITGPLVVSMRPIRNDQIATAVRVTSRYPAVHGAPVHVGDPSALGITDLAHPDFGDPVEIRDGETPVFWACGVTPQAAVMESKPPLAICHAPGHMLITDARDSAYQIP